MRSRRNVTGPRLTVDLVAALQALTLAVPNPLALKAEVAEEKATVTAVTVTATATGPGVDIENPTALLPLARKSNHVQVAANASLELRLISQRRIDAL
jgi:hypothetical protein